MANKAIQMKQRNGVAWDKLYPLSLIDNIFDTDGTTSLRDYIGKKSEVRVTDFGTIDLTGATDCTTVLQAARDYIAGQAQPPRLIFPAGIYKYSASPNWAIQDAEIIADGEVRLRYTGIDHAVLIDSGAYPASGVTNMKFGRFIIEAPTTAKNGVYVRAVHHSEIDVKVLGCGSGYAGLRVEFAVCTKFGVIVSNNEGGWYLGAVPSHGISLGARQADTEQTSYCTFINPILEGVSAGAFLESALGNNFIGGTMEGCSSDGVDLMTRASHNKFYSVDFEANANADIYCLGHDNSFIACDSELVTIFDAGSYQNTIIGGNYSQINVGTNALNNSIGMVKYNRFNSGKTILDYGTKTRLSDNFNVGLARHENVAPLTENFGIGTSPFTYTNLTGNPQRFYIGGGVVTNVAFKRGGVSTDLGPQTGFFVLNPTDELTVSYTTAPTTCMRYSM